MTIELEKIIMVQIMNEEKKSKQTPCNEIKNKFNDLVIKFSEEHFGSEEASPYFLRDLLTQVLGIVEYQTIGHPNFTTKQRDHICYQIGDWYLDMKPLLEGTHNLGYMKERLKLMICGDE